MNNKYLLFLLWAFFLIGNLAMGQGNNPALASGKPEMKQYFFVMLVKGPDRNQDSASAAKIQEGHMNNIGKLAKMGKIIVAGPFADEGDWRGIFIFNCETKLQVEEYLKTDPAVASGRLAYDIRPWWTSTNCLFK